MSASVAILTALILSIYAPVLNEYICTYFHKDICIYIRVNACSKKAVIIIMQVLGTRQRSYGVLIIEIYLIVAYSIIINKRDT